MYQTLYRKYRPKNFDSVVGQDVVVQTLKNSIKNNKINHAYIFFGPRGVGKTSIAKIFARTVNCDKQDGNICDECDKCISSKSNECLDIIEIDAASNNGVDEIRELRDKVNLVPSELKYKVYIIDEVHMLTIQAFNALLKTLEEPPAHVIFILATTDPQKVPETIISRCQCFSFDRISSKDIVLNLENICKKENIEVDKETLESIAEMSNGGMRDSIGMLDKLFAYCGNKITYEDFIKVNKIVSTKEVDNFIELVYENNINAVIGKIDEWNSTGVNVTQLLEMMLISLKNIIISSITGKSKYEDNNKLIKLSNLINENLFDIKKSSNPKIYIEIMLLGFMNDYQIISREIILEEKPTKEVDKKNNEDKMSTEIVEKKIEKPKIEEQEESNIEEIMKIRLNNAFATANKQELERDKEKMNKLNDYTFDQEIGYLVCSLLDSKLRVSSENYLVISYEYDSMVNENIKLLNKMTNVLKEKADITKKISIISDELWEKEKKKYVTMLKNKEKYEIIEEPELIINKKVKKEVNNNNIINDFGDIVEVE